MEALSTTPFRRKMNPHSHQVTIYSEVGPGLMTGIGQASAELVVRAFGRLHVAAAGLSTLDISLVKAISQLLVTSEATLR
jgi:hypothetical protein